jgi:hypothetical protein
VQYGFTYQGVALNKTEAIPKRYIANFVNQSVGRCVEVAYIPKDRCSREVFFMSIRETNPEIDEWDYTSLNSMEVAGDEIWELDGDLLSKLKTCISSRLDSLQSEFLPVLKGKYF